MKTAFIVLGSFHMLLLISCKETVENNDVGFHPENKISGDKKNDKSHQERITLGKTKMSLISKRPFTLDTSRSVLTSEEQIHYEYKEAYFYKTSLGSYITLHYSRAKEGVALSVKGGLEGALQQMIATMQGVLNVRTDADISEIIGYPALSSKGLVKSNNNGGPDLRYNLVVLNKNQDLYLIIGLFTLSDTEEEKAFEAMVQSMNIE